MPTKYDVFAGIIEHAPCKAKDLLFKTPVYAHITALLRDGIIKKTNGSYAPIKNKKSTALFSIIRYSLKNGLNYNKLLSKNMPTVLRELISSASNLRPPRLQSNKENVMLMNYL